MILRNAYPHDASALAALGRESFRAAFEHLYTPQDLQSFLDGAYSEKIVADEISSPRLRHQLAEDGSGLAGFCKLSLDSPYGAHSDAINAIVLGQLYTAAGRTGEGIGASLMAWALAEARQRRAGAVQLSVWAENKRAQAFYARYGFNKIADIDFWVGSHRDDEFLLELRLEQPIRPPSRQRKMSQS